MEMQLIKFLRAIWVTISSRIRYHNISCGHTKAIVFEYETLAVRARSMILRKVDILWRQVFNVILLRGFYAARKVLRHSHKLIKLTYFSYV